jgi:hypothetical protein
MIGWLKQLWLELKAVGLEPDAWTGLRRFRPPWPWREAAAEGEGRVHRRRRWWQGRMRFTPCHDNRRR